MSIQINDGGPGDACHSLKQELSGEGTAVSTVSLLTVGHKLVEASQ